MRLTLAVLSLLAAGCACGPPVVEPDAGGDDAGVADSGTGDAGGLDAGTMDAGALDAGAADAGENAGAEDAGPADAGEPDFCEPNPCLDGGVCSRVDAGLRFTCPPCTADAGCPRLRAQAGPDQTVVAGTSTLLQGSATGFNGGFGCDWRVGDAGAGTTCLLAVTPLAQTEYTLTVTDATGAQASDAVVVRVAPLLASAGPDVNITSGGTATLQATWQGASCPDGGCISCAWRTSPDAGPVASTCTAQVSPADTTAYFLTVTDSQAGAQATDTAAVFVTDRPAKLCGWNVVVLTSNEYPTAANPSFNCDDAGIARRQTVNSRPAIVLSDLDVGNVRITGNISVETSSDDDHIGFLWGWQNPKNAYLLSWKGASQNWTAACGNAPAGIALKKLDGALAADAGISFNASFGHNATHYVYSCADLWSHSRANASLLKDSTAFLLAPGDPGAHTRGWTAFLTYRFEFFYTPSRTRVLVYEDDARTGSTANLVTSLLVEDSSYPSGGFAFFSNSQEQVQYGDFLLASLSGYRADAGPDVQVASGAPVSLAGSAVLAVPPFRCAWASGDAGVATTCATTVQPTADTVYRLTVTDDFGRQATDEVLVDVTP